MGFLKRAIRGPGWRTAGRRAARGAIVVVLAAVGLTFLGRPPKPSMLVINGERRLGLVEANQFLTYLDKPIPAYVAWSDRRRDPASSELAYFRELLRSASAGHSHPTLGGLNLIAGSPAHAASVEGRDFDRKASVEEITTEFIWTDETRDDLGVPMPLPSDPFRPSLHIARIPPRAEATTRPAGHVAPDPNREAVWLRSVDVKPEGMIHDKNIAAKSPRARELPPGDYSLGWLFVLTKCDRGDECDIIQRGEASCLKPETLADHVLGMAHLIVPRSLLSALEETDGGVLARGGGQVLLNGADYDYVPLRLSLYPAGGGKPSAGEERPSQTRESSIAALDERLHEILAQINRAKDLKDGDYVLVLPSALDFRLGEGDYLIAGFSGLPAPLRSHYRGATTSPAAGGQEDGGGSPDQALNPAARISAAVDE